MRNKATESPESLALRRLLEPKPKALPRSLALMDKGDRITVTTKSGRKRVEIVAKYIDFSQYPGAKLREIRKTHR